jgi:hypothetical protein
MCEHPFNEHDFKELSRRPAHTTKTSFQNETWEVPRGFGDAYSRLCKDFIQGVDGTGKCLFEVIDLLGLIGYEATFAQASSWDLRRRVEAAIYACTEHAQASDIPMRQHPRPNWLPEAPWQGPPRGFGAFAGPGGTPVE